MDNGDRPGRLHWRKGPQLSVPSTIDAHRPAAPPAAMRHASRLSAYPSTSIPINSHQRLATKKRKEGTLTDSIVIPTAIPCLLSAHSVPGLAISSEMHQPTEKCFSPLASRKCVEPASASARKQQHFQRKSGKRVRVPNEREIHHDEIHCPMQALEERFSLRQENSGC
jgi:hypothetical protein|eukprot:COSAG01_NODE_9842_length_2322_cov_29.823450_1_plen_168_part_00